MRLFACLLAALAVLAPASVQAGSPDTPQKTQSDAPTAQPASATERVVITGETMRERVYNLFDQLDQSGMCPLGFETPRGFSCAQVTYEVLSKGGDFLRRCNLPIFSVIDGTGRQPPEPDAGVEQDDETFTPPERSGYFVQTFDRMTCGDSRKHNVDVVPLDQILNPRTSDGSSFKVVSILGYRQAKDICAMSPDHCVLDLFDHRKSLTQRAQKIVWPTN